MGKPSDLLILKTVSLEPKHGPRKCFTSSKARLVPPCTGSEQRGSIKAKRKETETGGKPSFTH